MLRERAPAKLNLYLHILDRRVDGLHELSSLVAFAEFGDEIDVAPSALLELAVDGPMAPALEDPHTDNLVLAAARALRARASGAPGARIRLEKHIPVGAGLGGGSADGAAALRALNVLWKLGLSRTQLEGMSAPLGADFAVCVRARAAQVEGAGERLSDAPVIPPVPLVIAHTKQALPTAHAFQGLKPAEWSRSWPAPPRQFADAGALAEFLRGTRNDLAAPALRVQPAIARLLADLEAQAGCLLARMSGSGAACFGIFESSAAAEGAAARLHRDKSWWAVATRLGAQ